jgi:regulator of protease activity HflC (stomatin/prohibitin superfamily)
MEKRMLALDDFKNRFQHKGLIIFGIIVFLFVVLFPPFTIVDPTEMAGIRRFGKVITKEPLGPGLHFKIPIVDKADTIQVSLSVLSVDNLTVYTIDNQWVRISIGLSYNVPSDAVLKLLYQIGRSGNFDVEENVRPIIADRALRVFAKRNTVKISEERETIAVEINKIVSQELRKIFGIEIVDLQISKIEYSPTFVSSVEAAVKAKNDAIAAENTVNRIRYEAEQVRVKMQGEADAIRLKAQADADAVLMKAKTESEAIKIRGEAHALTVKGQAVAENPKITEQTIAEKWDGQTPKTVLGNEKSFVPMLSLPKE